MSGQTSRRQLLYALGTGIAIAGCSTRSPVIDADENVCDRYDATRISLIRVNLSDAQRRSIRPLSYHAFDRPQQRALEIARDEEEYIGCISNKRSRPVVSTASEKITQQSGEESYLDTVYLTWDRAVFGVEIIAGDQVVSELPPDELVAESA